MIAAAGIFDSSQPAQHSKLSEQRELRQVPYRFDSKKCQPSGKAGSFLRFSVLSCRTVEMQTKHIHRKTLLQRAPDWWKEPCTSVECSLHQLAPYIGKVKSSIAGDLISRYSRIGDLVVDPFAGAGTVPLEAALRGRRVFAADKSAYARILSEAKLSPPSTLPTALSNAERALSEAQLLPEPDIKSVPQWVQNFFHPKTLSEALRFAVIARRSGNEFLMACFLGILHHQRPGFLSYPSSHLVPYLRSKKYPRKRFPELYAYRELRPRLLAKISRAYKRFSTPDAENATFRQTSVERLRFPRCFDTVITSPPYMNALDYGRDNRLRLWFIGPTLLDSINNDLTLRQNAFIDAITALAKKTEAGLRRGGYCVMIVGEEVRRSFRAHPAEVVVNIFGQKTPLLRLRKVFTDSIPDVRRTRREYQGVKTELFLVFQRR